MLEISPLKIIIIIKNNGQFGLKLIVIYEEIGTETTHSCGAITAKSLIGEAH